MTLEEWAAQAKATEALEGEPERPFEPPKVDAFVAWWMKKRENTSSPDDFYPLTDEADGDTLYDESYFEWEESGEVDRTHIHEILTDGQSMAPPPSPSDDDFFPDDEL